MDVTVDGIFTNAEYQAAMSLLAFSDFEDILRSSSLFSPYISSLTSTLTSDITCLLYSSLPLSYNDFPLHFSPLFTFNLSFSSVYLHFGVSSLPPMNSSPTINSSCSQAVSPFLLPAMLLIMFVQGVLHPVVFLHQHVL